LAVNNFVTTTVAINENRGAQQELSDSIKVPKGLVPFEHVRVRIPNLGV